MGHVSQAVGAGAEEMVDWTLGRYAANGLLAWARTYPEVKFLGKGQARATGAALPDRCVAIRAWGGRLLWLEIKTWQAKDRHSLRQRLHQFEQMVEFEANGGALGAYLVAWGWDGEIEWRLYPVRNLMVKEGRIVFVRDRGWHVPDANGLPAWLPLIKRMIGVEWLK